MLTEFGKFLRKMRIDRGELLKSMAEKLGVTSSYLSAVETGKRAVPDDWGERISRLYALDLFAREALIKAVSNSTSTLTLDLRNASIQKREIAFAFARKFEESDESEMNSFHELIKKFKEGKK